MIIGMKTFYLFILWFKSQVHVHFQKEELVPDEPFYHNQKTGQKYKRQLFPPSGHEVTQACDPWENGNSEVETVITLVLWLGTVSWLQGKKQTVYCSPTGQRIWAALVGQKKGDSKVNRGPQVCVGVPCVYMPLPEWKHQVNISLRSWATNWNIRKGTS